MTDETLHAPSDDEQTTARLLRAAGPRTGVSPERFARVRGAVHDEWRGGLQQRRTLHRRVTAASLLAAAACLALGVWLSSPAPQPAFTAAEVVGTIDRVSGEAHFASGGAETIFDPSRRTETAVRAGPGPHWSQRSGGDPNDGRPIDSSRYRVARPFHLCRSCGIDRGRGVCRYGSHDAASRGTHGARHGT